MTLTFGCLWNLLDGPLQTPPQRGIVPASFAVESAIHLPAQGLNQIPFWFLKIELNHYLFSYRLNCTIYEYLATPLSTL